MAIPQTPSPLAAVVAAKTYSAQWFSGATKEAQIQAAINAAVNDGALYVFVTANMLPYNASLITFSNAIRMLRESGNPAVSDVLAYGAAGDNSTNDTPSVVAAHQYVQAHGAGVLYFPSNTSGIRTYLLGAAGAQSATAIISTSTGVTIEGDSHYQTVLALANGANRSMIEVLDNSQGVCIRRLHLEGNKANQAGTSHGIRFIGSGAYVDGRHRLQDLEIFNFLTDGIITEFQHSFIEAMGVGVRSPGRYGYNISGSDGFFINCYVNLSGDNGWELLTGFNHFVQCSTFACGRYGVHVASSAVHCKFYNFDTDSSQQHNIFIQAAQTSFITGVSRDPGQAATATYSHIATDPALDGVQISGIDFKAKTHANQALFDVQVGGANGLTAFVLGPNSYEVGSFTSVPVYANGGAFGLRCAIVKPPTILAQAYSAAITLDLALCTTGDEFDITATNATPFSIAVTNVPVDNHVFYVRIANTSGGALGAVTWSGSFKQAGIVIPANGFSRIYGFQILGTGTCRLVSMSPADIPN